MDASAPVIEVHNLVRHFRRADALNGVSLSVPPGCVYGLVGENGAGKTTLIKHILGALKAKEGTVRVFGMDPVKDAVAVLADIGYLSEGRDMPGWMSIRQLLRYTAAFYPKWDPAFAQQLLADFELDPGQKIRHLSRGKRALTGLLLALAHRPKLLVLDEPSSGLDPIVRKDILGAIVRTVADEGRTVFFSSHLLDEIERVADYVTVLAQGRVALSDRLDTLKDSHYRLVLRFETARDRAPDLPGALRVTGRAHEWTVLCNGRRPEIIAAAQSMHAKIVEESPAPFDDIFAAYAKPTATRETTA
jgi:ABC-2 type transport system ATP-binding protein